MHVRSSIPYLTRYELNLLPAASSQWFEDLPAPHLPTSASPEDSPLFFSSRLACPSATSNLWKSIPEHSVFSEIQKASRSWGPSAAWKMSPRKAAKTYIGCTAGFELQINSKKKKKISMCMCHAQFGYIYAKNKILHIWNSSWTECPLFLFAKDEKHPFLVHSQKGLR